MPKVQSPNPQHEIKVCQTSFSTLPKNPIYNLTYEGIFNYTKPIPN
jgi:hypothetical protein